MTSPVVRTKSWGFHLFKWNLKRQCHCIYPIYADVSWWFSTVIWSGKISIGAVIVSEAGLSLFLWCIIFNQIHPSIELSLMMPSIGLLPRQMEHQLQFQLQVQFFMLLYLMKSCSGPVLAFFFTFLGSLVCYKFLIKIKNVGFWFSSSQWHFMVRHVGNLPFSSVICLTHPWKNFLQFWSFNFHTQ